MREILDMLDKYLREEKMPDSGLHPEGLCRQVKKSAQVHPVTELGNRQVSINDRYDGQWFHRILNTGTAADEDNSFGGEIAKKFSVRVRTVLMTKVKLGDKIKYDFANAIPESIELEGYRLIDISEAISMTDTALAEDVYVQEFGQNSYEKYILNWNIVALEYDIEFIPCELTPCEESDAVS